MIEKKIYWWYDGIFFFSVGYNFSVSGRKVVLKRFCKLSKGAKLKAERLCKKYLEFYYNTFSEDYKAIAKDILNAINGHIISDYEWQSCSDYSRADLKRKAFIVIEKMLDEHKYYTNDNVRLAHWHQVKEELELL